MMEEIISKTTGTGYLAKTICGLNLPLRILESGAGFYIGTFCEIEGPVSRESAQYWPTYSAAQEALDTDDWIQKNNP